LPYSRMTHDVDPKEEIWNELGDISDIELFHNQVLAAIYVRPEKTKSGIFLTNNIREEDKWQGKVGMIIKTGPDAFYDDTGKWFKDVKMSVGDWVYFRPSDGWQITIQGVPCRIIDDTDIRGRLPAPDVVW
jgi:co-chaperonin GroES (HSP10)